VTPLRDAGRELLAGFRDLVFAPVCLGCGDALPTAPGERFVCRACWSRARPLPFPRCQRCDSPVVPGPVALATCLTCESLPPSLRAVRSAYLYREPARRLVRALKFGGWHGLAEAMGRRMAAARFPLETEEEVRLVVPVPLSPVRLRERGYNQAERLADAVARARGWTAGPELLERGRATARQTTLHAEERRANVAGAFRVPPGRERDVRGEHVLVVDDVWTTGATALACTGALVAAGARAVSVLTFARALPERRS
jgi:ComF family protein